MNVSHDRMELQGLEFMGENVKNKLKKCGKNVIIRPLAKIAKPEAVEIGDGTIIDDYTFIAGGRGVKIGKYTHIASFVSIIGGGELEMQDFVGLAVGTRIITGTDDFSGKSMVGPCVPKEYKVHEYKSRIFIGKHAVMGTNVIVHPGVKIPEGVIVGSNSLVVHDLEPWSIYVGSPVKKIKDREKDILTLEKDFLEKKGNENYRNRDVL